VLLSKSARRDTGYFIATAQEDISMSRILSVSIAVALAAIQGSAFAGMVEGATSVRQSQPSGKTPADPKKPQGTEKKTDSTGKEAVKAPEIRKEAKK
jgi:hypothetical protein